MRRSSLFKGVVSVVILLQLIMCQQALAIDEKYAAQPLLGSNSQIAKDSSSIVLDTVFYNMSLRPTQTTFSVRNYISFKLDEYSTRSLPDSFSVTVTFKVYFSKLVGSNIVLDSTALQTLTIEYNKFRSYAQQATFMFSGGYRSELKIFNVSSVVSGGGFSDIKDVLILENRIDVSREYVFDPMQHVIQTISGIRGGSDTSCLSSGEYLVSWPKVSNADEYDLEWTFVDSSARDEYLIAGSQYDVKKVFRNNASRVSIVSEQYGIPLLFGSRGFLLYRVRPVRIKPNGQRIEALWSSQFSGGLGVYEFEGHEAMLNWQASTSFAEEGKRKSVVQYFDGTLRGRQTVTKDNSTCKTVVAETFYDHQGRPSIQVLPSPTIISLLQYTPAFNLDLNRNLYGKDIYDPDTTGGVNACNYALPGMDTSTGASRYYSANNPLLNSGYHKFIPDAQLYPFTETRYTPDNTGRIVSQGGVGRQFQINLPDPSDNNRSHETKYYYGGADQEELDALFGTEVGDASHYAKNMVRDANGQHSVSYVDMHGRTIATALVGKPAANLDTLPSSNQRLITKRLLSPSNNLVIGTSIVSSKALLVSSQGQHRFQYSVLPDSISLESCDKVDICYDCIYDLTITISNDCANPQTTPVQIKRSNFNISGLVDTSCNPLQVFPAVDTSVFLAEGSYTITKELRINQNAYGQYREVFLRRNTCKTLQQFIREQQQLIYNNNSCEPSCQECMDSLGTWSSYRSRYMLRNGISPADSVEFREEAWLAYLEDSEACDGLCSRIGMHDYVRKEMLADMTYPYGQYAVKDGTNLIDPHNIFHETITGDIRTLRFKQIPAGSYYKNDAGRRDSIVNQFGNKVPPSDPSVTADEFAQQFKPIWAETLLQLHPEYCQLLNFESYAESHIWDEKFEKVSTFAQAVDSGFINPCNFSGLPATATFAAPPAGSHRRDPFFTSNPTSSYFNQFRDSLFNYGLPEYSIWSMATIMAICDTGSTQCMEAHKQVSTAFTVGVNGCESDRDFIWQLFRNMYLAKKDELVLKAVQAGCLAPQLRPDQYRRFPNLSSLLSQQGSALGDPGGGRDSLNSFIRDNCRAYVYQWMQQMAPCNLSTSDSLQIIPRLLAVCQVGGDLNHPLGSSTTAPGVTSAVYQDTSFIQVLKSVLGSRYDSTCNAFLITAPTPYDAQPVYSNAEVITKPDSCQCARLNDLYQLYSVSGSSSFSTYLQTQFGQTLPQAVLDSIRGMCTGRISCTFIDPVKLPNIFQCNAGQNCITCPKMRAAYSQFKAEFPGIVPIPDPVTISQVNRNHLFERFMNYKFGFRKTAEEYLAFMDTCDIQLGDDSTDCERYDHLLSVYQSYLSNQHTPSPGIDGCDTSKIRIQFDPLELYPENLHTPTVALSNWMRNGILQAPLSDTSIHTFAFHFVDSICIDSIVSIEAKIRFPDVDSSGSWEHGGYGYINGLVKFNNTRLRVGLHNGKYLNGFDDSLYVDYTYQGASNYITVPHKYAGFKHFGDWITMRIKVTADKYYVYLNNQLTDSLDYTPPSNIAPTYLMNFGLSSGGRDMQIDHIKIYDKHNELRYYEEFLGCDQLARNTYKKCFESCAAQFLQYFNQQESTNYTYQQLSQLYLQECNIDIDPCYKDPLDCSHLKQMVVDYYHAPFNIIRDTSGLERNVWNLSYTYVARDLSEYSLKDFVRNGTISPPDSTTFAKGDFSYIYQLPMCVGNDFKFKTRVRVKPGFGADSLQLIMNFFTNNWNSAIVQFTGNTNFDGFQVNYIQNVNDTIRQQDFSQTGMHQVNFPDWRTVTIWFKDNLIKVYVDDTLRGSKFLTGDYSGLKGFSFGGWNNTPLEFDYVKIYDRNNVAQFIEEFDDYRYFAKVPYAFICPAVNCQSAFTNFFNSHASTQLTYNQIIQEFKEKCGIQFESCGIGSGPTLCGSVDPIFSPAEPHQPTACDDSTMISTGIGTQLYNAYIDSLKNVFEEKYLSRCLNARFSETFTVSAPISEFHYTLYYYDQAGNLVKTIPPAGVNTSKFAHARAWSDSVISARDGGTVLIPTHGLQTQYRYNTLNQVVQQTTPDAGLSNFWYDRLGRLAVSQNADQKLSAELNSLYSYTRYDHLGRISQVGQIRNNNGTEPITHLLVRNQAQLESWLSARNLLRGQITETYYDAPYIGFSGQESNTIWQRNLRNRVSFTSLTDSASMSAFNQATFYSYDIHGNVDTLLQDYGPLTGVRNIMNIQVQNSNRWKRMVYQYDLISGKVNHFAYQPPRGSTYYPDMFYHRYFYDAENRLTLAETSTDSIHWEKDMRYEYYHHGPLARTVTGEQQVQGTDYIYTLQGWIKGVNGINIADSTRDAGLDGNLINGNPSKWVARDAYGYNLNYFAGDYIPINANVNPFPGVSAHLGSAHRPLYNGNIGSMAVSLKFPNPTAEQVPQLYNYSYDQLNRLTGMDVYRGFNATAHSWSAMTTTTDFRERISYDGNGNILRYLRNGISSISTTMDSLRYSYYSGTNRLKFVRDAVGDNVYTQTANDVEDIDNQSNINLVTNPDTSNYKYTNIGNLRADVKDSIKVIRWNVYGKIIEIERIASSVRPVTNIKYTYDASGNRISKRVARSTNNIADYTWYVRDAQGNVIATYVGSGAASTTLFSSNYNLVLTEQHMYGSSRIGVLNRSQDVKTLYSRPSVLNRFRDQKNYELTNHLGNVLATLSDKKIGVDANSDGTIEYYVADVITANDYYPGGMIMPGRKYSFVNSYRYGFGGQEKSDEIKGEGNSYTAEFWEYDPRLGRRWNLDPKPTVGLSQYSTFNNNPISFADPKGDTTEIRNSKGELLGTHWGKEGNYVLTLNKENDLKWTDWRKSNFKELNEQKLSDGDFIKMALTQGNVYDINSAKSFYTSYTGKGNVDKISKTPISIMWNITLNGKKISQSQLREFIKKEKLGPEWRANWSPNQQGIMQLTNARTDNDLTEVSTGSHLAHLHPNTSKPFIITFNYKLAGDIKNRDGYAELNPKAPVDVADLDEGYKWGNQFPTRWNTVIEKNAMWFYNGNYDRFKINF